MRQTLHRERVVNEQEATLTARLKRLKRRIDQALSPSRITVPQDEIEQLIIENKAHRHQRLILFPHQIKILDAVNDKLWQNTPVRIICTKPRQAYGTTTFTAITYHLVTRHNLNAVVIGHKDPSSQNIYSKLTTFYKNDPYFDRGEIKLDRKNRRTIKFPSGAEIDIRTAGSREAATGSTYQIILATELAKWPRNTAAEQLRGLLNTVSETNPFTFIFIESTGEPDTEFQQRWGEALKGDSAYSPIFIPWHDVVEYHMPLPPTLPRDEFINSYTPLEADGAIKFGWSPEQIYWRRYMLINKCRGATDEQKLLDFMTEYPTTAAEAFTASTASRFPVPELSAMLPHCRPPHFVGELLVHNRETTPWSNLSLPDNIAIKDRVFKRVPFGRLRIWEDPQPYTQYAIGADVAEGIETLNDERDDSAIIVRNVQTGVVCAGWVGKIPPEDLGDILHCLGLYYNTAYICVEANNHGHSTLVRLRSQYPLYAIYRQRVGVEGIEIDRYGFLTHSPTKEPLLDQLAYAIRNKEFVCYYKTLLDELISIRKDTRGKSMTNGKDLTMAAALSEEAKLTSPNFNAEIKPLELRPDQYWNKWKESQRRQDVFAQQRNYTQPSWW